MLKNVFRDPGKEVSFSSLEFDLRRSDLNDSELSRNEESVEKHKKHRQRNIPSHRSIYGVHRMALKAFDGMRLSR